MRFDTLKETLLKAGIAPRHVRRYVRELDDHLADLTSAQREAGHDEETARLRARALLGGDAELAAAMLAQPGLKSLPARAPWLVFGLLPPILATASLVATILPLGLVARLSGLIDHEKPSWFQLLAVADALFANLVLGPGLIALLVWAAMRQRLNWKWPTLGAVLAALLGAHMAVNFAPLGVRLMNITDMFRANRPESWGSFVSQFLLTLAPTFWLLRDRFARLTEPR